MVDSVKKVLIIDDEENMRHMLSVLLDDAGYECEAASNGEEAIKAFVEKRKPKFIGR